MMRCLHILKWMSEREVYADAITELDSLNIIIKIMKSNLDYSDIATDVVCNLMWH
jgi:hypothetical protein